VSISIIKNSAEVAPQTLQEFWLSLLFRRSADHDALSETNSSLQHQLLFANLFAFLQIIANS
jgi:hypothetical protein